MKMFLKRTEKGGAAATAFLLLSILVSLSGQTPIPGVRGQGQTEETYDIHARIFSDENCFEEQGERHLAASVCYANTWSNSSMALSVEVVRYLESVDRTGKVIPPSVNVHQHADYCVSKTLQPIQANVGQCAPWLAGMKAMFSLQVRSKRCKGLNCSPVKLVRHEFFSDAAARRSFCEK